MTPLYSSSAFTVPSTPIDPFKVFPSAAYLPLSELPSITRRPQIIPDQSTDDELVNLLLNLNLSVNKPNPSIPFKDYSPNYGQYNYSTNDSLCCPFEYYTDDFMMKEYKVKECSKRVVHDWTKCPYAHNGERAVRRDPYKYPYTGLTCNEFRKTGYCTSGKLCENAHGIFEFWLHPTRFKTRMCEMGVSCPRRVCFFAHSPSQKRPVVYHDEFPRLGLERGSMMKKEAEKGKMPVIINWGEQERREAGSSGVFDETWCVDEAGFNELCKGFEDYPHLDLIRDLLMNK